MVTVGTLDIRIIADDEGMDLIINGRYTRLLYDEINSEEALRLRLQAMPPYIYNAVIALLKDMS
jgi:hypothetical protein